MSTYWDGVKRRWSAMVDGPAPPPRGTGAGSTGTGSGSTGTESVPGKEWELVYRKFRQIEGRDPYSFQELVDWWG